MVRKVRHNLHTFSQTPRGGAGFALSGLSHTRTDDLFNQLTSTQLLSVLSTTTLSVKQNDVSNGNTLTVENLRKYNKVCTSEQGDFIAIVSFYFFVCLAVKVKALGSSNHWAVLE